MYHDMAIYRYIVTSLSYTMSTCYIATISNAKNGMNYNYINFGK